MNFDQDHHAIAHRLFSSIGYSLREATDEEDFSSVADVWLDIGPDSYPVGLKSRGAGSGRDFNLTAWSCSKRCLLPEVQTAGGKLYFYTMRDGHYLIRHPSQEKINSLLPASWDIPLTNRHTTMIDRYSGIRRSSVANDTAQGFVFVPRSWVEILLCWNLEEKLV